MAAVLPVMAAADIRTAPPGMNFREAKRFLMAVVHHPGEKDYYCGCAIAAQGRKWTVDWSSCGFEPRRNPGRAGRVEWEHVVPASEFGRQRACWRAGGRDNCSENDPVFAAMEGDPYNLLPVVGEVNGDRGNLRYGMIPDDAGQGYGACGSRVDFKAKVFMPRPDARGDVARTYLYFRDRYGLKLSRQSEQLYAAWSQSDPVDARECRRAEVISQRTGAENRVLAKACGDSGRLGQGARRTVTPG
ncbi:MAG: endonuclease [Perlucidibaca sp.]